MQDLYALEKPGSALTVGVDVPGCGTLTLTLRRAAATVGAVVQVDTSAMVGAVEIHADDSRTVLVHQQPLLGKTA